MIDECELAQTVVAKARTITSVIGSLANILEEVGEPVYLIQEEYCVIPNGL